MSKDKRNISIIQDVDGKNIVLINDIRFKSRRNIDWDEIEKILRQYIGEFYEIYRLLKKCILEQIFQTSTHILNIQKL